MLMSLKDAKNFIKLKKNKKKYQLINEYWSKVAMKEEGYIEARRMEIECVRLLQQKEMV